ncbi:MAG: DUF4336 domain-containing protein [Cyanobacteria bacterium P01_A01_bin.84]
MLIEIDNKIWVAEQPLKFFGLEVGARMTLIRLRNDEIVVISPINLDDITINQINNIGNVTNIIAPNLFHYTFINNCKNLYPHAKLWAVPGLKAKQPEILVDETINIEENNLFNEIEYILIDGFQVFLGTEISLVNECVFFHPDSKSLILTDTAFNFDDSFPLITQFTARIIGSYNQLRPSYLEKLATKDKQLVQKSVTKILNWDFHRVIVAHGTIVEKDAKKQLKEGYEWFLNTPL